MWETKLKNRHKRVMGGVVDEAMCDKEVAGSNPPTS
jgi:hypothetical protein